MEQNLTSLGAEPLVVEHVMRRLAEGGGGFKIRSGPTSSLQLRITTVRFLWVREDPSGTGPDPRVSKQNTAGRLDGGVCADAIGRVRHDAPMHTGRVHCDLCVFDVTT